MRKHDLINVILNWWHVLEDGYRKTWLQHAAEYKNTMDFPILHYMSVKCRQYFYAALHLPNSKQVHTRIYTRVCRQSPHRCIWGDTGSEVDICICYYVYSIEELRPQTINKANVNKTQACALFVTWAQPTTNSLNCGVLSNTQVKLQFFNNFSKSWP